MNVLNILGCISGGPIWPSPERALAMEMAGLSAFVAYCGLVEVKKKGEPSDELHKSWHVFRARLASPPALDGRGRGILREIAAFEAGRPESLLGRDQS